MSSFILKVVLNSAAWLAVTPAGRTLLSELLKMISNLLPNQRLLETDTLLAFQHPRPSYPIHILLVPKKPLKDLMDLSDQDQAFVADLFFGVQELIRRFALDKAGYRLITNGGSFQDFPYLHFHLIAESAPGLE